MQTTEWILATALPALSGAIVFLFKYYTNELKQKSNYYHTIVEAKENQIRELYEARIKDMCLCLQALQENSKQLEELEKHMQIILNRTE